MKLSLKLSIAFLSIGIIAAQIIFWQSYISTEAALKNETFNKLTAIRESKKSQIESYFNLVQKQIVTLAENHMVIQAAQELRASFHQAADQEDNIDQLRQNLEQFYSSKFEDGAFMGKGETASRYLNSTDTIALQNQYIVANHHPVGAKDKLDSSNNDTAYNQAHARYHPVFRNYIERHGFYDLFIADTDGNIVYSVAKEVDYATNLINGPFMNSNIGELFRRTNREKSQHQTILVDFKPYLPSSNAPAAFIATPLFSENKRTGVLILQLSIDEINSVMTGNGKWQEDGLGMSGETYLLGPDFTMRSDSRFLVETPDAIRTELSQYGSGESVMSQVFPHGTSVLLQEVKTAASIDALAGNVDTRIINDYRYISVLSSYSPVTIQDFNWVILSEIDVKEAFAPLNNLKKQAIISMVVISFFIVLFGLFISKKMTTPLHYLLLGIKRVEEGDIEHRLHVESEDEFGNLAASFNQMSNSLQHTMISKDYLDNILSSMSESLLVIQCKKNQDCKAIIKMTNPAAVKMFGISQDAMLGQDLATYFPNNEIFSSQEWQDFYKDGQSEPIDKSIIHKSGKKISIALSAALLNDNAQLSDSLEIIFVAQDISQRKEYEDKIQHLADHDTLTGLPNRRFFNSQLTQITAQARRYDHQVAVMFIDLDKFKPVNDTLGHDAGDDLLKQVAQRLSERVRVSDIVARLGGDEFAAILPQIKDKADAVAVTGKILETLRTPFNVFGNKVEISGSIGVALFPDDGTTSEEVLKHADTAMYFSKKAKRGSYCFYDSDMNEADS